MAKKICKDCKSAVEVKACRNASCRHKASSHGHCAKGHHVK